MLSRRAMLAMPLLLSDSARADDRTWGLLRQGGHHVFIRHAVTTPGVGDPENFRIGDCATQRNLSDAGRLEARKLGDALRSQRVPIAAVVSSPWCRCIETARIATAREPELHMALSNLFGRAENREAQVAQLGVLTSQVPRDGNVLFFTHGSTTLAFTGVSPMTGEMVVVARSGAVVRVVGRIATA